MTNEARNNLAEALEKATAEELHLATIFLTGLKYARTAPDSKAAKTLAEINSLITQGTGHRQEVIDLTNKLAAQLKERN